MLLCGAINLEAKDSVAGFSGPFVMVAEQFQQELLMLRVNLAEAGVRHNFLALLSYRLLGREFYLRDDYRFTCHRYIGVLSRVQSLFRNGVSYDNSMYSSNLYAIGF